ncbi:MAG: hypothetical protein U1E62_01485 [Alsobacter sp.]
MANTLRSIFGGALGGGLRDPVLSLVLSSPNTARKTSADLRLRLYHDTQTDELMRDIAAGWSDEAAQQFRPVTLNLIRKIVDKRAAVYTAPPARIFEGMDQAQGDALYAAMRANVVLKKANRYTQLLKNTALRVAWDETRQIPRLFVIPPSLYDVTWTEDPECPDSVVITNRDGSSDFFTLTEWTPTTYRRLSGIGSPIPVPGNPSGVNPYGMIPLVHCFATPPDDVYFQRGGDDLITAQKAVNVALSNIWRATEFQAHGQLVITGASRDFSAPAPAIGPTSVLYLDTGSDAKFINPNAPVGDMLEAISFLLKQTALANNLPGNIFELQDKAESGVSKAVEERDLIEARADDIELWRSYEADLFQVLKRVVNTHAPGTIPEGATMRVDFGDLDRGLDDDTRLKTYQARIDMGIWSPVDAFLADNPDVTDREQARAILQERLSETQDLDAHAPFQGVRGVTTTP